MLAGPQLPVVSSSKIQKGAKTASPAAVKPGVLAGRSTHHGKRNHLEGEPLETDVDLKAAMRRSSLREIPRRELLNPALSRRNPDERSLVSIFPNRHEFRQAT